MLRRDTCCHKITADWFEWCIFLYFFDFFYSINQQYEGNIVTEKLNDLQNLFQNTVACNSRTDQGGLYWNHAKLPVYLCYFVWFSPLLAFRLFLFAFFQKIQPMLYSFGAFPPFFEDYHGPQIPLFFSKIEARRLDGYTVGF